MTIASLAACSGGDTAGAATESINSVIATSTTTSITTVTEIAPTPTNELTATPSPEADAELLGKVGIWTSTDGDPLTGAAFEVNSCGGGSGGGAVDMAQLSNTVVPVDLGCWMVSLTQTPAGYRLDGPVTREIGLDTQTDEVNMSYRFLPI